jgi:hygromycin-B 7''-O-kinase
MTETTLRTTEDDYGRRFGDPAFGADLADIVAARHGLAQPLVRKVEGSNLVYRTGDGDWLKISPPFFGDAFEAEVAVTARVKGRLPLPIPEIKLTGALEDWSYLVSAHVPGVAMGKLLGALSGADVGRIADDLGGFMAAFHGTPPADFERSFGPWPRYLNGCLDNVEALHRSRGNDEGQVADIVRFLAPYRSWLEALGPPVLIHADLTDEHVMLAKRAGRWRVSGVLDLADAMVGPAALDLIAPFVGLFRGQTGPQTAWSPLPAFRCQTTIGPVRSWRWRYSTASCTSTTGSDARSHLVSRVRPGSLGLSSHADLSRLSVRSGPSEGPFPRRPSVRKGGLTDGSVRSSDAGDWRTRRDRWR